ncbi:unnamed protein product [Colias eurytheme]|nr:unnamed protein product [Colias eurytheme]
MRDLPSLPVAGGRPAPPAAGGGLRRAGRRGHWSARRDWLPLAPPRPAPRPSTRANLTRHYFTFLRAWYRRSTVGSD